MPPPAIPRPARASPRPPAAGDGPVFPANLGPTMQLSKSQKRLLERVINVFETGTPDGKYHAIAIFHDGPHDIRQITYGRSQTTEYGNLHLLVKQYAAAGGTFSQELGAFAERVGRVPLTDHEEFKTLLRRAGKEDAVMRQIQDDFFERVYFRPAMKWADEHGLTRPLSALVIYDSFIHSGSILQVIRNRFAERPPSAGGDEKKWISAYVNARHDWLGTHRRPAVRKTTHRTACFKTEVGRDNWDLALTPIKAHGVDVSP